MNGGEFITKYNNHSFSDEYKNRGEFLEYFKKTSPEEYRKYRDKKNKERNEYIKKLKVEDPEKYESHRKKHNSRLLKNYYKNKTWYQNYYKEYIKNPINREKNIKRAKEWYWNNKSKNKDKQEIIKNKTIKNKTIKNKTIKDKVKLDEAKKEKKEMIYFNKYTKTEKKPAIKIDKLSEPIIINFSL